MAKGAVTDEVQVLHFFETSPLERAEAVFNIVAYRMEERLRGSNGEREERTAGGGRSRKREARSRAPRPQEGKPNNPNDIAHPPGQVEPGNKPIFTKYMAWRPYSNLISGELDNRTPGEIKGWMKFFRHANRPLNVEFNLRGDFENDIRGKVIRLSNACPTDRNAELGREGTYMEGFSARQVGEAGDITAGISRGPWTEEIATRLMLRNERDWQASGIDGNKLKELRREHREAYAKCVRAGDPFYWYVPYPYIEWYSDANGRVVLELEPSQVDVVGEPSVRSIVPRKRVVSEERHIRELDALFSVLGGKRPPESPEQQESPS